MKSKYLSLLLAFTVLLSCGLSYDYSWAANEIEIKQTAGTVSMEGVSRTKVSVEIINKTESDITGVTATINSSALTYEPYTNKTIEVGTIGGKKSSTATWEMNTRKLELGKTYKLPITVTSKEGFKSTIDAVMYIFVDDGAATGEKNTKAVININPTSGNLAAGVNSSLTVSVNNIGNTTLNDIVVNLSALPDGVTPHNTNAYLTLGSLQSGKTKSIDIPISISSSISSGNHPFTASITAIDEGNKPVTFTQTNYIELSGGQNGESSLSIASVALPKESKPGDEFNLSFSVRNDSSYKANDVKISVKAGDGLVNKTKNTFIESSFEAGASKSYTVTFFSLEDIENKNIPVEIIIETKNGSETNTTSQYEGVFIGNSDGSGSIKTPQLIVNTYNYGSEPVRANEEFTLSYTLYNTSTDKALRNIKVSLSSENGTFIPVGSSNTMYIQSVAPGKSSTQTINLMCKPDAEQKTIPVTLDINYEDTKGNEYSANEIISVPVVQKTKLKIDEPTLPFELYVGQQAGLSIDFYNVGKTTLSNLTVTAEGNFDVPSTQNYFAGNLEPGKQDSYDLTFIPREVGLVEGVILFTFEDSSGKETTIEEPFSVNAMELPIYPEDPDIVFPEENPGMSLWQKVGIGLAVLAVAGIGFWMFKKKKKKKEQELTIDEE